MLILALITTGDLISLMKGQQCRQILALAGLPMTHEPIQLRKVPTEKAFLGLWWDSPMESLEPDPRESQKCLLGREGIYPTETGSVSAGWR